MRSVSLSKIVGMAMGLIAAVCVATQSFATTIMALTFDESPQPTNTPLPFVTADISGSGNPGYIHDFAFDGGLRRPFDQATAFSAFNPFATQFAPEAGGPGTPAGPFGGGPGHYIGVYGDYIELTPPGTPGQTPNNDLSFTGDFTVEFWFRTGEQVFQMFGLDDGATLNTIKFFMQGGAGPGKVSVNLNGAEGEGPFLLSTNTYSDFEWHHVAVVRDATAGTGTMYLDGGAGAGGETVSAAVDGSWTFSEPYTFSYRLNGSGNNAFRSIIQYDELRISDVALAESALGFFGTIVPQPSAISDITVSNGIVEVVFDNLDSGTGYDVEINEDLTCDPCWSNALSFTAAGTSTNLAFPATVDVEAYRLAEQ